MPKDMLGSVVRAAAGVPQGRLELLAEIASSFATANPDGAAWHKHLRDIRHQGLPGSPKLAEPPVELPPLLVFDDEHYAAVDLSKSHDPASFWKTTKETPARYLWGLFRSQVVALARVIQTSGIVKVPYTDLPRSATGRQIIEAPNLGDFDPSALCPLIAEMIGKQPNGEFLEHGLLNDCRVNLFKCGSVLVNVSWYAGSREWSVDGWYLGHGVGAGHRVFSGNLIV